LWQEKVVKTGKRGALHGLEATARRSHLRRTPVHRAPPAEDTRVALNKLDNADKHRLLHPAFVYRGVDRGVDLLEIFDPKKVKSTRNLWSAGQPLEDGTNLALSLSAAPRAGPCACAVTHRSDCAGEVGAPWTGYTKMINRVRGIADQAVALIER
jgi:hypothetical protein